MKEKVSLVNATVYAYDENQRAHLPRKTSVLIEGGIILALQDKVPEGYTQIDLGGKVLVPAFYDTHCHGGGPLVSPTEGRYSAKEEKFLYDDLSATDGIQTALTEHSKHGAGSMHLSTMAVPEDRLHNFLRASAKQFLQPNEHGAVFRGADLESPFFCDMDNGGYIGAQNPRHFVSPSIRYFRQLQDVAGGSIKRVAIGFERDQKDPEKPAKKLADYLHTQGIPVGIGHSGAREGVLRDVMSGGGKFVYVHLGNGLNKINLRRGQARPFESVASIVAYAEERGAELYAELILDGVHLDDRFVRWAIYMFGKEKIVGVTDNIGLTGEPPTDRFSIAGTRAVISPEDPNAIWVEGFIGEKLCGSKATMDMLLKTYIRVVTQGGDAYFLRGSVDPLSLNEAMDMAIHSMATNPARLYGYNREIGSIEPGKEASLVALSVSMEPLELKVENVWVRGHEVK